MSPAATTLAAARDAFQRDLLGWYAVHRRRLPWRESPSLYKTVVSEFMLQQTQVKTVLPYFDRWLQAFPDFTTLAAAPEEQVLKLWEGLGYYSRARNLHQLARRVAALPSPPATPEAWRELPGVGPYTAAAITSIGCGAPAACVDGNVVRILARLTADDTAFRDSTSAAKAFTPLAEALLTRPAPGDHNQAMMELGATVCVRHQPLCTICPVRSHCAGCRSGAPEGFPRLAAKIIEQVAVARVWCERPGALLLYRTPAHARRLANQHELPTAEQAGVAPADLAPRHLLARKKRGITRFAITESIFRIDLPPTAAAAPAGTTDETGSLVWVTWEDLPRITLSGPHRRWIEALRSPATG